MFGLQRITLFATLLTSTFVFAAPQHHDDSIVDWGRLTEILDTIDNNVLHSVLHNLSPKFRDGVFSKDRAAIEHVHSENPVMASKLVYMAKRQNNGTTTAAPTSAAAATSTTSVSPVAPAVSSAVSSQITQSALPSPTTVLVAPSTPSGATAVSTIDGGVVYSTIGGGVVTATSSAVGVSFTKSTSTHYFYSTGANGQVTTSTSLVIVNAPVTATAVPTGAAAGAATSSGSPGLQNDAPRNHNILNGFGALLVGVLGLFVAL
ncbi:hypothetical protein H2198_006689 [Neophaeococcomyces mojaviensis]|uniref:Uncharacterized protein n=1 Tax=Neophaeococcomyces mojaviensis TaxID=3383035 RepID=A0ACC3A221_9EURO|nr:hypothetical protein H2198_006689 [Knufia sp. JES_112]